MCLMMLLKSSMCRTVYNIFFKNNWLTSLGEMRILSTSTFSIFTTASSLFAFSPLAGCLEVLASNGDCLD